jgi:hypothetical protein
MPVDSLQVILFVSNQRAAGGPTRPEGRSSKRPARAVRGERSWIEPAAAQFFEVQRPKAKSIIFPDGRTAENDY